MLVQLLLDRFVIKCVSHIVASHIHHVAGAFILCAALLYDDSVVLNRHLLCSARFYFECDIYIVHTVLDTLGYREMTVAMLV